VLILERFVNEEIMIGDDVRLVVTKTQGNRVWIGFDAPEEVKIHRREVYDAIVEDGPLTSSQLAKKIGSTPQAVGKSAAVSSWFKKQADGRWAIAHAADVT